MRLFQEIPFVDGAEAVYIESATHKTGLLTAEEWAKKRPFMLMIEFDDWDLIKGQWYEACRVAGPKCNLTVDSIDELIKRLDAIARAAFGPRL